MLELLRAKPSSTIGSLTAGRAAVQQEPGSPGEGDQRVLNKYQKNQGASESATAITQAAGADRLRRGQLPQCAPRLTVCAAAPSSHFGGQPPVEFFDSGGQKGTV